MLFDSLYPKSQALCDKCLDLAAKRGFKCPFLKWNGRFCEQIRKISSIEKALQIEIDNVPLTGRQDFSELYKNYGKAVFELSFENCFRNGKLPQNMPEVL